MTINRHNYEEYFLMYTDGELSPGLQHEVEQFAAQHPDLASELQMLLDTKLPADDSLLFFDKESLLKPIGESISTENYQEKFLLYIDNELNETAKADTERFVLQHPELQEAFTLMKQTKLEPEVIPHPDKASLYHQEEEEEKPVIFMMWTRMIAVAAIFMGLAVGVWNIWPGKNNGTQDGTVASAIKDKQQPGNSHTHTQAGTGTTATSQTELPGKDTENAGATSVASVVNTATANSNPKTNNINTQYVNNRQTINTVNATVANNGNNNATQPDELTNEQLLQIAQHKTQQAVAINNNALNPAKVSVDAPPVPVVTASLSSSSKPYYKQLDTGEDEQEVEQQKAKSKPLYIASVAVKKEEVNNFMDKAKRIFSKSAEDEDKVAIASFALSKKSLR